MNSKYKQIIEIINSGILEFNQLLTEQMQLPIICESDPRTYTNQMHKEWGHQGWPSKDEYGVYFLLAYNESSPESYGLYIGKASNMVMGHRMYAHLKPYRETGKYMRRHGEGNFIIDEMCAVPFLVQGSNPLATALEEFLIARGIGETGKLLNSVGVRNPQPSQNDLDECLAE